MVPSHCTCWEGCLLRSLRERLVGRRNVRKSTRGTRQHSETEVTTAATAVPAPVELPTLLTSLRTVSHPDKGVADAQKLHRGARACTPAAGVVAVHLDSVVDAVVDDTAGPGEDATHAGVVGAERHTRKASALASDLPDCYAALLLLDDAEGQTVRHRDQLVGCGQLAGPAAAGTVHATEAVAAWALTASRVMCRAALLRGCETSEAVQRKARELAARSLPVAADAAGVLSRLAAEASHAALDGAQAALTQSLRQLEGCISREDTCSDVEDEHGDAHCGLPSASTASQDRGQASRGLLRHGSPMDDARMKACGASATQPLLGRGTCAVRPAAGTAEPMQSGTWTMMPSRGAPLPPSQQVQHSAAFRVVVPRAAPVVAPPKASPAPRSQVVSWRSLKRLEPATRLGLDPVSAGSLRAGP